MPENRSLQKRKRETERENLKQLVSELTLPFYNDNRCHRSKERERERERRYPLTKLLLVVVLYIKK